MTQPPNCRANLRACDGSITRVFPTQDEGQGKNHVGTYFTIQGWAVGLKIIVKPRSHQEQFFEAMILNLCKILSEIRIILGYSGLL
jgi:hypothetical protein